MVRELQHQRDAYKDLACTNFRVDEKTGKGLPTSSTYKDQVLGGEQDEAPLGGGQERDHLGGVSRHSNSSAESGADQPL